MRHAKALRIDDNDREGNAERFNSTMRRILTVSKEELAKREDAYQKSRANRDRPGPKRRK